MEHLNQRIKINKLNFKPGFSNIEERELPLMQQCWGMLQFGPWKDTT